MWREPAKTGSEPNGCGLIAILFLAAVLAIPVAYALWKIANR